MIPIKVCTSIWDYLFTTCINGDYIVFLTSTGKIRRNKDNEPCMFWKDYKAFVDVALEI